MAYNPVGNGRKHMGSAAPWAKSFASLVAGAWVRSRSSRELFANGVAPTGRSFVVLPKVGRCLIEAVVFYRPKLSGNRLDRLLHATHTGDFESLVEDWSTFGRAFVQFSIDTSKPHPLNVLDHDGTIRSVNELVQLDRPYLPSLRQFDEALGCSLVAAREECARVLPLSPLSELPDDKHSVLQSPKATPTAKSKRELEIAILGRASDELPDDKHIVLQSPKATPKGKSRRELEIAILGRASDSKGGLEYAD